MIGELFEHGWMVLLGVNVKKMKWKNSRWIHLQKNDIWFIFNSSSSASFFPSFLSPRQVFSHPRPNQNTKGMRPPWGSQTKPQTPRRERSTPFGVVVSTLEEWDMRDKAGLEEEEGGGRRCPHTSNSFLTATPSVEAIHLHQEMKLPSCMRERECSFRVTFQESEPIVQVSFTHIEGVFFSSYE